MNNKAKKKVHIYYLDALKGFTILLVVLGHIMDGYLRSNLYPTCETYFWVVYNLIYSFHMALFFMISGYVYSLAYFSNDGRIEKEHIKAQIIRLGYVYVLWSILLGGVKILFNSSSNSEVAPADLLLIPIKAIGPYWYLYVLIIYYVVFSMQKIRRAKSYKILAILVFLSILTTLLPYTPWFELNHIFYFALYFAVGGILYKEFEVVKFKPWYVVVLVIATIVSVGLLVLNVTKLVNDIPVINIICAVSFSLAIWKVFSKIRFNEKSIFVILGKYSLDIYLIHCFLTAGNRVIFKKLGITNPISSVILNLIVSTIIPVLVAKLSKKMKVYPYIFSGKFLIKLNRKG